MSNAEFFVPFSSVFAFEVIWVLLELCIDIGQVCSVTTLQKMGVKSAKMQEEEDAKLSFEVELALHFIEFRIFFLPQAYGIVRPKV